MVVPTPGWRTHGGVQTRQVGKEGALSGLARDYHYQPGPELLNNLQRNDRGEERL